MFTATYSYSIPFRAKAGENEVDVIKFTLYKLNIYLTLTHQNVLAMKVHYGNKNKAQAIKFIMNTNDNY